MPKIIKFASISDSLNYLYRIMPVFPGYRMMNQKLREENITRALAVLKEESHLGVFGKLRPYTVFLPKTADIEIHSTSRKLVFSVFAKSKASPIQLPSKEIVNILTIEKCEQVPGTEKFKVSLNWQSDYTDWLISRIENDLNNSPPAT